MSTDPHTVLQLIDTLDAGGAERVALNLANTLPRERWRAILGTTRRDGPLADQVADHVDRLRLDRRGRFDLGAVRRLARFLRDQRVALVHAHTTTLFLALAARALLRRRERPRLLWHDHFGRFDTETRPVWLYRPVVRATDGVVAVGPKLAAWSRDVLGKPADHVWYLPNFVVPAPPGAVCAPPGAGPDLPGRPGSRIACVANFRTQKDHPTLIDAFARLRTRHPDAHLLLVGSGEETRAAVEQRIAHQALGDGVHLLGRVDDVAAVLAAADVGVLASRSEGLPLALLEYGVAALATVATEVGQCAEVLDQGNAGLLVPPSDVGALADALATLIGDAERRRALGQRLAERVATRYSPRAAMDQLEAIYRTLLGDSP